MRKFMLCFMVLLGGLMPIQAQSEQTATVPDVVGLTIPEAAAALNKAGLQFGEEIIDTANADPSQDQSAVTAQSLAAGSEVARGTAVDLTVRRSNNMLLIYDDNDVTLVNQSGGVLNLGGVAFSSSNTRFNANQWGVNVAAGDCVQLWSVGRNGAKSLEQCGSIARWLTTNNSAEHFWTGANADADFAVIQNGAVRADCPKATVAGEVRVCEFFLAAGGAADGTEYVYLAYTPTRFQILNNTASKWMGVEGIRLNGVDGRSVFLVPERSFFDNSEAIIGNLNLLAPQQCIYYVAASAANTDPMQPCDEIGRVTLPNEGPFIWNVEFNVVGTTGNPPSTCPAATEGRLTLCIVPR